jgi:5S rRNA maturation endonuclease (ribonuclease M5)
LARQREAPTYYLDECLDAESIYQALLKKGALVIRHRDKFSRGTQDVTWLPVAGAEGWVVITTDGRIQRVDLEIQALWNSSVAAFIFRGRDMKGEQIGAAIAEALPKMGKLVHQYSRPFIARITKSGDVALVKHSGRKADQKQDDAPT